MSRDEAASLTSLVRAAITATVVFGFSYISPTAAIVAGFFCAVFYSPAGNI